MNLRSAKRSHRPHSGTRRSFWPILGQKSVILSAGTPLSPCGIAPHGAYGLSTEGLFKNASVVRCVGGWFRGGLVCKAHRLLYHSTLGLRVIKKKTKDGNGYLALFPVDLADLHPHLPERSVRLLRITAKTSSSSLLSLQVPGP